jgi:hypothetical protein
MTDISERLYAHHGAVREVPGVLAQALATRCWFSSSRLWKSKSRPSTRWMAGDPTVGEPKKHTKSSCGGGPKPVTRPGTNLIRCVAKLSLPTRKHQHKLTILPCQIQSCLHFFQPCVHLVPNASRMLSNAPCSVPDPGSHSLLSLSLAFLMYYSPLGVLAGT